MDDRYSWIKTVLDAYGVKEYKLITQEQGNEYLIANVPENFVEEGTWKNVKEHFRFRYSNNQGHITLNKNLLNIILYPNNLIPKYRIGVLASNSDATNPLDLELIGVIDHPTEIYELLEGEDVNIEKISVWNLKEYEEDKPNLLAYFRLEDYRECADKQQFLRNFVEFRRLTIEEEPVSF